MMSANKKASNVKKTAKKKSKVSKSKAKSKLKNATKQPKVSQKSLNKQKRKTKAPIRKTTKLTKEKSKEAEEIDITRKQLDELFSNAYVRQLFINVGGENALAILRNFSPNITDEKLARSLKISISDVRATLNRLHNEGLVKYTRERDNETGWYSYSWSLNAERIKEWTEQHIKNQKIDLDSKGDHYFCPCCGIDTITPFEKAVENNFKCPKCSKLLEFIDEEKANELFGSNKENFFSNKVTIKK
jgi:transcription initiation factor TFIIE subunit alpha